MEHITVCICTYKRPRMLRNLLESLAGQETDGLFEISVSIVDNDRDLSAKPVVEEFLNDHRIDLRYAHSPEKNLALLRNLSLSSSRGQYVAFIDDDERPPSNWLLLLYRSVATYQADGALGPVVPEFQAPPPRWIEKGKIFERLRLATGSLLDWRQTRTGNAIVKRDLVMDPDNLFDLKYKLGAEDDAFFRKLMDKGHRFIWCDEAIVYEAVPPERLTLSYQLRRSRLIGFMAYHYYEDTRSVIGNTLPALKSGIAMLAFSISLPIALACGYHHFANSLIRVHYHNAVLLAALGLLKIEDRDL